MSRVAVVLLLAWSLAILARPVLADETQSTNDQTQEHTTESERATERAPEREHDHKHDETTEHDHESEREHEHEPEPDDDSDSAPFMIVVQHGNGRRCGGSLVSLRTALTSAWCVRGEHGGDPRELWALAPSIPLTRPVARRVARVALAAGADSDSPPPHLEPGWGGGALDIAVLELESPFGVDARSRPILMATQPEDCDMSTMCHVVRALGHEPRLRIVDEALVPGERCGAVAPGWPGLRDTALCLAGPDLCMTDRGAGVVCDGKLCGVLSRSARDVNTTTIATRTTPTEEAAIKVSDDTCGDIHVAQSVARWRRFLHCAHTLRACGSGGECAKLCSERQLMVMQPEEDSSSGGGNGLDIVGEGGSRKGGGGGGGGDEGADSSEQNAAEREPNTHRDEPDTDAPDTTPQSTAVAETSFETQVNYAPTTTREIPETSSSKRKGRPRSRTSTRLVPTHTKPTPPATVPPVAGAAHSLRPSFEFEPNRADFKGGPARTSRVYLKAGEYGDNAADYGGEESVLSPSSSTSSTPTTTMDIAAAGRISEMAAQRSVTGATTPRVRAHACSTKASLHIPSLFVSILIYAL